METDNPKVSIITVVYNGAKTIEDTIISVVEQSYCNIEYIIIDGQSTDGTLDIIKKYKDKINCVISEKDNGLYDAMNKGIRQATGDIIGIINSDDWYEKDSIAKVVSYFKSNDVDLVYGKMFYVFSDGTKTMTGKEPLNELEYRMVISHPTVFIKKNIYEKYGVFDTTYKLAADYDLLLRFYHMNVKFGFVDDVIAFFRVGGSSYQHHKVTNTEHIHIVRKYIETCVNKSKLMEKSIEWENWSNISALLISGEKTLSELICSYFSCALTEIIIWGTGYWGMRCYELLQDSDIKVTMFVDNNPAKWEQEINGIPIIDPNELRCTQRHILIAVRYYTKEIKEQICALGNQQLKYVAFEDLSKCIEDM